MSKIYKEFKYTNQFLVSKSVNFLI